MKSFISFIIFLFFVGMGQLEAQNFKHQKKYLPGGIKKMKVYLGASKKEFLKKCPSCKKEQTTSFREVYVTDIVDDAFETVIFYISTRKEELYEMILISKKGQDIKKVAKGILGEPNHDKEWRFESNETKQPFTLAGWTYKNKLILAADLAGSEWEPGFND